MGRSALWGLLIGTALMTILIMFGLAVPSSDEDGDRMWAATFIASGMVGVVMGGIPGTLIGLLVGAVRRPHPCRCLPLRLPLR